nr:MAG TPA: Carbapenem-associated resistance protein [Caudoviricetes sp.]
MGRFDLSALALKAVCPTNDIIYDDKGLPSIMVFIPKFKIKDVISGGADSVHSAFIVNGKEVDGIYISKYQNVVNNSRAYSLPCEDLKTYVTLDQAISYCSNKGEGWHVMTRAEWAAIALWCKKNGTMPNGNNNWGKDTSETISRAIPTTYESDGRTAHVATGTGPVSWSHDGTLGGIWDLNGNVWEWNGGLRTVKGEVQVLVNNNAADLDNSQSDSSAQWKAIDATTGNYLTPNGSGTTANSIKMDWVSNKLTYTATITAQADASHDCNFANITCAASVSAAAQAVLKALALMPDDTTFDYKGDQVWFNNGAAERAFFSGGDWHDGAHAGLFALTGNSLRSGSYSVVGFRSAFVSLPSA